MDTSTDWPHEKRHTICLVNFYLAQYTKTPCFKWISNGNLCIDPINDVTFANKTSGKYVSRRAAMIVAQRRRRSPSDRRGARARM